MAVFCESNINLHMTHKHPFMAVQARVCLCVCAHSTHLQCFCSICLSFLKGKYRILRISSPEVRNICCALCMWNSLHSKRMGLGLRIKMTQCTSVLPLQCLRVKHFNSINKHVQENQLLWRRRLKQQTKSHCSHSWWPMRALLNNNVGS